MSRTHSAPGWALPRPRPRSHTTYVRCAGCEHASVQQKPQITLGRAHMRTVLFEIFCPSICNRSSSLCSAVSHNTALVGIVRDTITR